MNSRKVTSKSRGCVKLVVNNGGFEEASETGHKLIKEFKNSALIETNISKILNTIIKLIPMPFLRATLLFFFVCSSLLAQEEFVKDEDTRISKVFTLEEENYINDWFNTFAKEMNLSEEISRQFHSITSEYIVKFNEIGKGNPDITKLEISEQFNSLMEKQHMDVNPVLTEEQFEVYLKTMKKVVWSFDQRLRQL